MTETLPPNLQRPSIKPYIRQAIKISAYFPNILPSKCYKYIHHLEFASHKHPLKGISRLKYLQSFHPFAMPNPCLMQKLVKPYRKYIKSVSNRLRKPGIQKLLPRLDQMRIVSYESSTWKILVSRSAFQKLLFNPLTGTREK